MKNNQKGPSIDGPFLKTMRVQILLTPEESKKLIALGLISHPKIKKALYSGKVLFKGGSTVGYVSELICGVSAAICGYIDESGTRMNLAMKTPHVFMIQKGKIVNLDEDEILFEKAREFTSDDVVICGGNAIDGEGTTAMLIGSKDGGGIPALFELWHNQGAQIIVPIGYEKMIPGKLQELTHKVSRENTDLSFGMGVGLVKIPGKSFTELDAIQMLAKVDCYVFSSGGLGNAQGSLLIEIKGSEEEVYKLVAIIKTIKKQKDLQLIKNLTKCIPGCKHCEEHRACLYYDEIRG